MDHLIVLGLKDVHKWVSTVSVTQQRSGAERWAVQRQRCLASPGRLHPSPFTHMLRVAKHEVRVWFLPVLRSPTSQANRMGVPGLCARILPCPPTPTPVLAVYLAQQHLPLSATPGQDNQVLVWPV